MNKEYIIYIKTLNNTKYYYTNNKYNKFNLTCSILNANRYKKFQYAKMITTRLNLFDKYFKIKGFRSLHIDIIK